MTVTDVVALPPDTTVEAHFQGIPLPIRIPAYAAPDLLLAGIDHGHYLRPVDPFTLPGSGAYELQGFASPIPPIYRGSR